MACITFDRNGIPVPGPSRVETAASVGLNAGIDSFSKRRKWGGVEGLKDGLARMAAEANVQVDWRLMSLANGWTLVSTISSRCHFHLDVVSTLLFSPCAGRCEPSPLFTPACN
jgi:hypothetical protein